MWLNKIKNPMLFQGNNKSKGYFEGWYYKQISEDEKKVISFIPGISLFNNDVHCFVQYIFVSLDDYKKKTIKTGYVKYSLKDFKISNSPFRLQIGENIFTESMISIKLLDEDLHIEGKLKLGSLTPIKRSILSPNIMGCFAYIPKMECYHGIVSMNHIVNGMIKINEEEIDINNGKGYIEKDWGNSFPKKYIWIQANNFENINTSIFCSIADIPFMSKSFMGYICNLVVDGREYRFATYNNSKLKIESITNEKISILLENNKETLRIEANIKEAGELIAPEQGKMQKIIKEEVLGEVKIHLYNNQNSTVYEDTCFVGGIEIVGF
ncbi:tocopherol cyclase family protein [Clostridium lacusfryxellense]|uniref:tocopherol cyclase family protein n=1 Tax=Clostridium lacusfryxellense TaxID=205328 RepID=UPI001C0AA832|nr:tocopherol cyclase family protein [Clostridium lacusfryxellense]MBU3112580.1 tocopherol cyclase family protein [Clostridium lacusfryxellense]